jgi:hypothetical protein
MSPSSPSYCAEVENDPDLHRSATTQLFHLKAHVNHQGNDQVA